MKVFFDTNVIIDAITERNVSFKNSRNLIIKAANESIDGYICSTQITDIYYILRKYITDSNARKMIIRSILETFKVLPLLPSDLQYVLNSKITDFEDAILEEVAKVNMIKSIVTNNKKDFKESTLTIYSPEELNLLTGLDEYK